MKMDSTYNIIIGLGNHGEDFEFTRHNVGFEVLDILNSRNKKWTSKEHYLQCINEDLNAIMIKPTTGMNSSGLAVYNILSEINEVGHIIVIHDDMDFNVGQIRIKVGGGDGRHNGLKSIINHIGSDFIRVRIGIGKPRGKGLDFVLGRFSGAERKSINEAIQKAAIIINWIVKDGPQRAMAEFNRKDKEESNGKK